jgi:hypothetical protein
MIDNLLFLFSVRQPPALANDEQVASFERPHSAQDIMFFAKGVYAPRVRIG